jgi:hypothetical protein
MTDIWQFSHEQAVPVSGTLKANTIWTFSPHTQL